MGSYAKFDLNIEDAKKICKKHGLETPTRIARFGLGMINDVFSLDQKYVVKVKTGSPELSRFRKEKELYDLLKKKGVPSPKTYAYDNSKDVIPYAFILMEHVQGKPLSELWPSIPSPKKGILLGEMGKFLAKIHSIHFSHFGEDYLNGDFTGPQDYREYLSQYVDHYIGARLEKSDLLSKEKVGKILDYFKHSKLFDNNVSGSLLHGNYNFDNIVVENYEIKAIVDLEWAKSAHNEEEVATFIYRVLHMEKTGVEQFRQGYEKILGLDKDFEKRLYSYNLLYYARVLPSITSWTHRPDKQKEYREETEKLFQKVIE
jgi:aminoglycoside phosphotransferase (APT) family kinase protein